MTLRDLKYIHLSIKKQSNCYVQAVYYPATNLLLEKGEQLVDYGSNMPDVWANGKPLSQELTIIVEIFNHLKTGCVSFPSKTICSTAQRDQRLARFLSRSRVWLVIETRAGPSVWLFQTM